MARAHDPESDMIVEGFNRLNLRYTWMIGNGDSSIHFSVSISVPYGRHVQIVKCSYHAVKCYRDGLEKLAKENASFRGRNALTSGKIHQLWHEMCNSQPQYHQNVPALRHDLYNCP